MLRAFVWVSGAVSIAIVGARLCGVRLLVQLSPGVPPAQLTLAASAGTVIALAAAVARAIASRYANRRAADQERYIQNLSEASQTFTYVLDLDARTVIRCNDFLCRFIGYTEAQIVAGGLSLMRRLTHPDDWRTVLQHFVDIHNCVDGDVLEFEQRLKDAKGEWRWVLFRESVLDRRPDGTARVTRGTGQDITERKEVENALREGRQMLERVIDCAAVGMALLAPDGRPLRVNTSLCEFLGYRPDQLLESDFDELTHPEDLSNEKEQTKRLLEGSSRSYSIEKRYVRMDGRIVWAQLSVSLMRDGAGDPLYLLMQVFDITERKSYEEVVQEYARVLEHQAAELDAANRRLEHQASTDPLTGLFNRRMLDVRLRDALALALRFDRPLALILFDVDNFKAFNDMHGHSAGDDALKSVAAAVRAACRPSDVVARFGGEEFAVVCPDTDIDDARVLAERLRQVVSELDSPADRITCSFGVTSVGPDLRDAPGLIADADSALYRAKGAGRNRVCWGDDNASLSLADSA